MTPNLSSSRRFTALVLLLLAPVGVRAQLPDGVTREQMWPAPTAADWERPCLITFQRTWEDAVAVSKETKRPILVCVNMDGEIASEHYAGIRYRQPDIAKLYEPYVAVIASTYRHTPRDHDEHGNRIPCPRFGSVTCGEHIAIEPLLYERFMEGQRVAPRHIMVELDGKEVYDVFYAWDTDSVFKAIKDGIAERALRPEPVVRGDRSLVERVASRDVVDREAVEKAFKDGDAELRRSLLEAARAADEASPTELLRLGVFGLDLDRARQAREVLAGSRQTESVDLIGEALAAPMEDAEREALVAALSRLGAGSVKARRLSVVHRGLGTTSQAVNVTEWSEGLKGGATYAPAEKTAAAVATLQKQDETFRSRDPKALAELSEAFLANGLDHLDDGRLSKRYVRALFADARQAALDAEKGGAGGWRVNSVLAVTAFHLGDREEAHRRAAAAVRGMPEDPESRNSALVLGLHAEALHQRIVAAVEKKEEWPGQWLTDMHAAHSVLLRHPHGTDQQAVSHYDFLRWLGAAGQANRFLDEALKAFPGSYDVHDRLRRRTLVEQGVEGLEAVYARLLEAKAALPAAERTEDHLEWYAAYAQLRAAEYHRRRRRPEAALSAYDRSIALFERSIAAEPGTEDSSDAAIAMALAGKARLALEAGDLDAALERTLAGFERKPDGAADRDGLNLSAVDTAKMLLARLKEAEKPAMAKRLEEALAALDPKLLELPAFERGGRPPQDRGNRPGRRGRRRDR